MFPVGDEGTPPSRGLPFVNLSIIGVCVAVFLIQLMFGADTSVLAYGTVPYEITHNVDLGPDCNFCQVPELTIAFPVYVTLLTSMFMHASWLHIGGNLLFLYIFGDNVEDAMGHAGYLIFYLLCGLLANLAQVFIGPNSTIPGVGASGAIAGVLAAYLVLFPQARVRVLVGYLGLLRVPALLMIGFWFATQLISGIGAIAPSSSTGTGGVAYWAHVGGFVAGLILVWVFRRRNLAPAY